MQLVHISSAMAYECGRRFLGLGCRGSTGVTGIARGGDLAGRLAACLARASTIKLLVMGRVSVLRDDCLKGCARICGASYQFYRQ